MKMAKCKTYIGGRTSLTGESQKPHTQKSINEAAMMGGALGLQSIFIKRVKGQPQGPLLAVLLKSIKFGKISPEMNLHIP